MAPAKKTAKAAKKAPKPKGKQTRQKTLYYKRASFIPELPGGQTLADLIELALGKRKQPSKRMERLGGSTDTVRVINKCYNDDGMICGRFLDYTEGGATAVLEIDDEAEELKIRELLPEEKEQYLEGVLTFGLMANHVVLVQSKALKVGHFENHLNWFLGKLTEVIPEGHRLLMRDEPAKKLVKKLEKVSSVTLREPVPGAKFILSDDETPKHGLEPIIAGLQAMVPSIQDVFGDKLTAEQALALEDLDVSLRITRKRKKGGVSVLDDVAHVLRNVDDVEVVVRAGGTEFRSDDLKLSASRSMETEAGGLLKLQSAAETMRAWLANLVSTERVAG